MYKPVVLITGANRGIGRQTALALSKKGFVIVMACRNIGISEPVRDEIRLLSGNEDVDLIKLDLADLKSVFEFVGIFRDKYKKLNILINNAGVFSIKPEMTSYGFEKTVGINFFGPYLLTKLLLPLFPDGEDNRIINVSSVIYPYGYFKIDRINDYRLFKAYAVSKYAILLNTIELSENLKDKYVSVNAVHPGVVRTTIFSRKKIIVNLMNTLCRPFLLSPEEGARPLVNLAVSDKMKGITGKYFRRMRQEDIPGKLDDSDKRKELIVGTEKILMEKLKYQGLSF
jgi:NAD(P)-dependent dehydrogenase (short-subunit alcohol dehydrogenase family)